MGDARGVTLPLMNDLPATVGVDHVFDEAGVEWKGRNFEELYDDLYAQTSRAGLRETLEREVRKFFEAVRIPSHVTAYDYLLLSLREKDVIATFNWDPLLIQAYRRNAGIKRLPNVLFLHGNVGIGICTSCKQKGFADDRCRKCSQRLQPTQLLYPIAHKDYERDPFIKSEWSDLREVMEHAYFLTIFGYSAPKTDSEAIKLMKDVWDTNRSRELAQIEIIDIREEEQLLESWQPFIVRQHYSVAKDIQRSYLSWHPRRSCEALAFATLQLEPWPDNWIPTFSSIGQLQDWIKPLLAEEDRLERFNLPFSPLPGVPGPLPDTLDNSRL